MYAWMIGLLMVLLALPAQGQSLEPAGSQVVVNCGFDTNTCAGQVVTGTFRDWNAFIYGAPAPIASDASATVSPPRVLDSFLPLGTTSGGAWVAWYNSVPHRELYLRGRVKLNSTFGCNLVGVTKLTFLRAYENRFGAPITNGVFQMRGCGQTKTIEWSHNTGGASAVNNSHICGGDAVGNTCFPNVGPGTVERGAYFDIETCVSASTSTTAQNGVVWWAINGVMAGRYTTVNYGGGVTNEWVGNNTWDDGPNGQGYTSDTHVYWDHLYLSVPPAGGCLSVANGSGGTPLPTLPPLGVSGLRFGS